MSKKKTPKNDNRIGMSVGGVAATADPKSIKETASSVVKVLEAGHKAHADQETIRHALSVVKDSASAVAHGAYGTTITGSEFRSG